jgi:hypothetical protein
MNKAKSSIKNESIEFDVEKIRRFTQQELERLSDHSQELPFCYQIGTDVLVGRNRVVKINDRCWRVYENGQQGFDFFTRKDAIFYCIALHKNQTKLAKEIYEKDNLLNRLEFDAALFRHRYKKADAKKDDWGMELYSNKYLETMRRIEQTKQELKKSINSTKYIKV